MQDLDTRPRKSDPITSICCAPFDGITDGWAKELAEEGKKLGIGGPGQGDEN